MAQKVRMPDGVVVGFPDDMPREEIAALIESKFPTEIANRNLSALSNKLKGGPGVEPPAPKPNEGYASSHVGQTVYGVNEGIADLVGLPTTLGNLLLSAGPAASNALLGTDLKPVQLPDVAGMLKQGMASTGMTQPATDDPVKNVLRRTGQQVGASLIPVGRVGTVAKEIGLGVASGLGAGIANEIAPDNPWADLLGQAAGFATAAGAVKGVNKLVTPFAASPGRVKSANFLEGEGVGLTAGQKTGSKKLQYLESELGGEDFVGKQGEQFTAAALKRVGVNANRATPDVMDDAFTQNGKAFNDLAANNDMVPDRQLGTDLTSVVGDYRSVGGSAPIVDATLQDIIDAAKSGAMSGKQYKTLTSKLARLARGTQDPELRTVLYEMRNAIDDAMERSIAKNNPADLGMWQEARTDYKNLLVLEDAVARAGEAAASGIITPANLRSAVQRQGKRAYVRGKGDFNELAHAGAETMTPLPNSGTAARLTARGAVGATTGAVGAMLGGGVMPGVGHVLGGIAGLAAPAVAGKAVLSRMGRKYLGNQLVRKGEPLPKAGLAANMAITAGSPQGRTVTLRELIEGPARSQGPAPVEITINGGGA